MEILVQTSIKMDLIHYQVFGSITVRCYSCKHHILVSQIWIRHGIIKIAGYSVGGRAVFTLIRFEVVTHYYHHFYNQPNNQSINRLINGDKKLADESMMEIIISCSPIQNKQPTTTTKSCFYINTSHNNHKQYNSHR